jgi:ABC-2 type transport system ATP-binding protein
MNYRMEATQVKKQPAIAVHDLEVRRGENLVLPGISLDIRPGVVTGLLGPSGSGKSTFMRAVVGVQIVAGGEVEVLGRPAGHPELRHEVAYVTQHPSVYGDLTVRQNLDYFARVMDEDGSAVHAAIAQVGLERQTDQFARTLSGGQRGRASLAAALLGQPRLLVLDEPTVGLDPVLRQDLWRLFHELAGQGKTVLISTHVMDEADRCDELILMREGAIVATGSPAELRERTGTDDIEKAFMALARDEVSA